MRREGTSDHTVSADLENDIEFEALSEKQRALMRELEDTSIVVDHDELRSKFGDTSIDDLKLQRQVMMNTVHQIEKELDLKEDYQSRLMAEHLLDAVEVLDKILEERGEKTGQL